MKTTLKIFLKIVLGNLIIIAIPVILFFLFVTALKVNDLIVLKSFPLLSCFIGFYLAGIINRRTKSIFLLFLFPALTIYFFFRAFYFPFLYVVILFAFSGLLVTRKEVIKKIKISILTISILVFGYFLFSQPLIIKKEGFGHDVNNNLHNALVLWDFSRSKQLQLPNIKFEDVNGNDVNLRDFTGKTIYITFWATWCGPCIEEIPILEKFKLNYSDSVMFIDISLDKNKAHWKDFITQNNLNGIQLITKDEVKTHAIFQFDGIPYNILVNSNGNYKPCLPPAFFNKDILSSSANIDEYIFTSRKYIND